MYEMHRVAMYLRRLKEVHAAGTKAVEEFHAAADAAFLATAREQLIRQEEARQQAGRGGSNDEDEDEDEYDDQDGRHEDDEDDEGEGEGHGGDPIERKLNQMLRGRRKTRLEVKQEVAERKADKVRRRKIQKLEKQLSDIHHVLGNALKMHSISLPFRQDAIC